MLPNFNEKSKTKVQDTVIKESSSGLENIRHLRSQSSSFTPIHHEMKSSTFENNKRGWLETKSIQVNPSRSLDIRNLPKTTATMKKPLITDASQKGL